MATVRVGIVGAGGNTKKLHIPNLQKAGAQIVAVCNRTVESARRAAEGIEGCKAYDDWTQLMADPDIDAVVVGTWPYMHRTLVLAALAAGKHILTEARLAMTAGEAREMLRASHQHPRLVAQVVPSPVAFTFEPAVQRALDSGCLGDIFYVEVKAVANTFAEAAGAALHWRHDVRRSGLNVGAFGIMFEPLQRWLGEASAVTALGQTVVKRRKDPDTETLRGVLVPDHLIVTCQMAAGAQAHILISSVMGGVQPQGAVSSYSFYGTQGSLHLDLTNKTLRIAPKDGPVEDVEPQPAYSWRVEEEFIGAIRGRESVQRTTFTDAVHYMEVTEAVTMSMQRRRTISLPLLQHD